MKNITHNNQIQIASVLSYVSMFFSIIISFIYTPFLIKSLGKSEYGLYNTTTSIISIVSLLSLGFNSGYIQYYTKYKKNGDEESVSKLNGLYLILFCIIGFICFAVGILISNNLNIVYKNGLTNQEYILAKHLMILLTINLSISMPMNVFKQIIISSEHFIFLKILSLLSTLLNPLLMVPALLNGYKSEMLVIITISIALFIDIMSIIFVFIKIKSKFIFSGIKKELFYSIFKYTIFIAIHLATDQINRNLDKVLIGRFAGTSEVSVYSVGYNLYAYFVAIGLAINGLFTPKVHSIVENNINNKKELRSNLTNLFTKVGRIQFIIVSLLSTGIIFFGKSFISYWVGEGYNDSYYIALLLIIPGSIDLIQNIGIEMQRAQNLHKFRAIVYIFMAFINIIISVYLCKLYGAIGSAIGTSISFIVVQGIIINIYYQKKCNINVISFWKEIFRMFLGLIIPIIFGFIINSFIPINNIIEMLLLIVIYTIIYILSMYFISLNKYEKNVILKIIMKVFRRK